jgi:trans-2,3-dihydro-3-hydroxyanthranilate isomerase
MARSYLHYDVFTDEPLVGNQLAVFTDAQGLDTSQMQRISREMNFSESTFILPTERPDTDVRMRIFTPYNEMPMAGHPTIGSTFALAHSGAIKKGAKRFVFGLNIGPTPVDLEWADGSLSFAWMTQRPPTFGPIVSQRAAVAGAIGLKPEDLADHLPVQEVSCGVPYLYVALRNHEAVDRAVTDAAGFGRLCDACGLDLPLFLFSVGGPSPDDTVYGRMFAPDYGIIEDPATGSAAGPVGCYLVHHGVVQGNAAQRIQISQGVAMGRPSRIFVSIDGSGAPAAPKPTGEGGDITDVRVGGGAVLVGRGELLV